MQRWAYGPLEVREYPSTGAPSPPVVNRIAGSDGDAICSGVPMEDSLIKSALGEILKEKDPTLKALRLASLCSRVARDHGLELVVVGGSAIEILTEGAYVSGDLDLCFSGSVRLTLRERQQMMGQLHAAGGPRSWEVAGAFVDLLGPLETHARTPLRQVEGPYGVVMIIQPEELLVERVLVSVYPQAHAPAREAARKLFAVALQGGLEMSWPEVRRIAELPDYRIFSACETLAREVAYEVKAENPFHSH